jgi:hypothetical protein
MPMLYWCGMALAAGLAGDDPRPADLVRVVLEPFVDSPDRKPRSLADFLGLTSVGFGATRRGSLSLDGHTYTLFLPAGPYSVTNLKPGAWHENTATRIGVDHDANGTIVESEIRAASLPLRIGDRMFDVKSIEPDGSAITLEPSSSPLESVVAGRTCPPFSWKTQDGKDVSLADFRGKILILDIWSYT